MVRTYIHTYIRNTFSIQEEEDDDGDPEGWGNKDMDINAKKKFRLCGCRREKKGSPKSIG